MALERLPGPHMWQRTTLRLGGRGLAELRVGRDEDLVKLPEALASLGGEPMVLGRGSNLLARDGELPLVAVSLPASGGPEVVAEDRDGVTVSVGAGLRLPRLLAWCAERGLSGLEGLAGVPGAVGGAVAMNAGSYGTEMSQALARVLVFTERHGLKWFAPGDCETGYRRFGLRGVEGLFVVARAELLLRKAPPDKVRAATRANYLRKKATQPVTSWTAGSLFKNPPDGLSAGRLLDQAGLRGVKLGGVGLSDMHANFLVNLGKGTSNEALELIEMARERVRERFGVELELEVKVCPCC